MNIESWPVSKLLELPTPYDFTHGRIPKVLSESIRRVGIATPPRLFKGDSHISLLSGKRRIVIYNQLQPKRSIDVQILSEDEFSKLQAFQLHFFENVTTRILNPLEKSNVLRILTESLKISLNAIIETFAPYMDLAPKEETILSHLKLQELDETSKDMISMSVLQPDTAIELLKFKDQDRPWILKIVNDLHLGVNPQKSFVKLLWEIFKKTGISISDLAQEAVFNHILDNNKWSAPQKWNRLELELMQRRFPILSHLEAQFSKIKKELKLPPSISLQCPPYFETSEYLIQLRFKNIQEYRHHLATLNAISQKKELEELFQLTGENGKNLLS